MWYSVVMNNKQGFSNIAVGAIVAIIVLGVAGYFVWQGGKITTSNWTVYRDDRNGFEFKYPPELKKFLGVPGISETFIGFSGSSPLEPYAIYPAVAQRSFANLNLYTRNEIINGKEILIYERRGETGRYLFDIGRPEGEEVVNIIHMSGVPDDEEVKETFEAILTTLRFF